MKIMLKARSPRARALWSIGAWTCLALLPANAQETTFSIDHHGPSAGVAACDGIAIINQGDILHPDTSDKKPAIPIRA